MQNKPQLFCFTYAGGNTTFFDEIENDLEGFEVVKLEYSGHGSRHKEALYQNFSELADDMYSLIKKNYSGGDYALFGYSMGTISLVEVLIRITERKEISFPRYVFLAAHEPKTKMELAGFSQGEQDEKVKERTIRFGAVPERLINNKSFWRMYLPLYRADYSLIGKYRFEELSFTSDIPAVVFYSESDTKRTDMEQWNKIFIGNCYLKEFTGNHFFIHEYHGEMAEIIRKALAERKNYDI